MSVYHGWAFGVRAGQMTRDEIRARYAEIKHIKKEFDWSGQSKYAHNTFTAAPKTEAAAALSAMDVMIMADDGNLCFGGDCVKGAGRFSGSYNTD